MKIAAEDEPFFQNELYVIQPDNTNIELLFWIKFLNSKIGMSKSLIHLTTIFFMIGKKKKLLYELEVICDPIHLTTTINLIND